MVGNHVPERPGPLVEFAAPLDADRLGRRDLDVVDMRAIPDRLENAIGKAQRHHVLHRFLAEEMVDPIDLALAKRLQDLGIERPGGTEVVAERLLDHDPAPLAGLFIDQASGSEAGYRDTEETIGDREVKKVIAGGARLLVEPGKMIAEPPIRLRIVQIALQIRHAIGEPAPCRSIELDDMKLAAASGDELIHRLAQAPAPLRRGFGRQINADELKPLRQTFGADQVVERRHHQPLGQVAGGAEDHHGTGRRCGTVGLRPALRPCRLILLVHHLCLTPLLAAFSASITCVRAAPWQPRRSARVQSRTCAAAP